jgi:hypothetical protein
MIEGEALNLNGGGVSTIRGEKGKGRKGSCDEGERKCCRYAWCCSG